MEDDHQFCLRWNNHQSTLIQNFDTLLESGTLVDCTLAAEGKYLKAHKVVLSACSPYFEGLLSEHYDKHPVFILKDVKFKELKAMMDYMYRGEVNISQDQLAALLKAAESLQIKGLSESKNSGSSNSKADTRQQKVSQSTALSSDIPHASSGLTIEKNSKVPRQSLVQASISDLPEDSTSPQIPKGLSSREGSQSPTNRKRKRCRRRSLGDDNSLENNDASNSSDMPQQMGVPALGIAPVADEKTLADQTESMRSAIVTQLTKNATDEMLQMPVEKPEPNDNLIEPKSEYDEEAVEDSVEDLTLDDEMNDDMEQDNNRAGPSHDPSQRPADIAWHNMTGDRINAGGVVGPPVAGATGAADDVFLAAQEAAQAHRDSQEYTSRNDEENKIGGSLVAPAASIVPIEKRSYLIVGVDPPLELRQPDGSPYVPRTDKPYMCKGCGKGFSRTYTAERHWNHFKCIAFSPADEVPSEDKQAQSTSGRSRKTEEKTGKKSGRTDGKFKCPRCGRSYQSFNSVKRHLDTSCGVERSFQCIFCSKMFAQQYCVTRHMRKAHKDKLDSSKRSNIVPCSMKLQKERNQHLPKRNKDRNGEPKSKTLYCNVIPPDKWLQCKSTLTCLKCDKTFSNLQNLKKHMNYYCEMEPSFQCPLCPRKTRLSIFLAYHMNIAHSHARRSNNSLNLLTTEDEKIQK
ncbi:longitudinals lacking protein, isoforms H/M/V isoform X4 [Prorops nasuta]|uniref:longitudinals lacking protein, isoforms H/M/V isoform X4 n=1 Tax=Prorops nasuta TaxID=863751 RepID=UPI0034CE5097